MAQDYNTMIEQGLLRPVRIQNANLLYYVDAQGEVYSTFKGIHKLVKHTNKKTGYQFICVQDNRTSGENTKRMTISIHRMIIAGFLKDGDYHFEGEANHINMITYDNRLENLEIVTRRENQLHRTNARKYTGVLGGGKLKFYAKIDGKHLGSFKTESEAAYAIKKYVMENEIVLPKYFKLI